MTISIEKTCQPHGRFYIFGHFIHMLHRTRIQSTFMKPCSVALCVDLKRLSCGCVPLTEHGKVKVMTLAGVMSLHGAHMQCGLGTQQVRLS